VKALLALALCAGVAHAQPAKKTKLAPDKFTKAASEAFTAAATADTNGDLRTALGQYEKAHAISPHPSTIYNIADVQRRLSMLRQAIKSYETYLVMVPDAKDRAEVETLIDQLSKTPGTLIIHTTAASDRDSVDLAAGFVLVDGELKRRPGPVPPQQPRNRAEISIQVPPGEHVVDLVTSLTYATRECDVDPGGQRFCELEAEPRIDGTAVVSAINRRFDVVQDRRGKDMVHKRVELPAGKHRLLVKDRSYNCAPLPIEVTGGNSVAYAFINTTEWDGLKRCRTLDIKQHRLQFEP
jgi:tetratricopeptide (TPR) repeat protein